VSFFDALTHAMTALSTGGYSPHDASIGYFREQGYRHFVLIEYTIILAMLLGGMSFFIHYRLLTGNARALWDNLEMRLWWMLVVGATVLVAGEHILKAGQESVLDTVRYSLFQVVSILTTTGFATKDIGSPFFPAMAKQIFLVLMVVGGCVGSTSGGIKVLRIGVLLKMVRRQLNRVVRGRSAVSLLVVDGEVIPAEEVRRISALFFTWMLLLVLGPGVTSLFSRLGPLESASGMFSALGNIGPCYISASQMSQLAPIVKVTYILGMLAGRLEILPILLLFSPKAWP
ncbi:MAG: TrkH family potassium uptake protein, partial [Planctomycetes bacterium]|nr:TrkH family potassium uptake protein [Planctomycetota bacterium]